MSVWMWVVVAFLAGGLLAAGITVLLIHDSDAEKRMRRLRREYEQYQAEVARHFSQTGELLSRLRTAFDQLYNEVEERATALVGEEALQRRLEYLDDNGRATGRRAPDATRPLSEDRATTPGFGAKAHVDEGATASVTPTGGGQEAYEEELGGAGAGAAPEPGAGGEAQNDAPNGRHRP